MTPQNSPEIEVDEAVFFKSKPLTIKKSWESVKTKQNGVQSHNKITIEEHKNCSEKKRRFYGLFYSFRSERHEVSVVRQLKMALNTFDVILTNIKVYHVVDRNIDMEMNFDQTVLKGKFMLIHQKRTTLHVQLMSFIWITFGVWIQKTLLTMVQKLTEVVDKF